MKAILTLVLLGSMSLLFGRNQGEISPYALEEIKIAILDLKQELSRQRIEIDLLQEKIKSSKTGEQQKAFFTELEAKVQNKMGKLEQMCQKMESDLQLFAKETTKSLIEYKQVMVSLEKTMGDQSERLEKLSQLKATLASISKAVEAKKKEKEDVSISSTEIYLVKGGDSLEKIARDHQTTVETLKTLNQLKSTTIITGQKLKVPSTEKGS